MVNNTSASSSPVFKNYVKNNFAEIFSVVILVLVVITTFLFENKVVGLESGFDDSQPKHHGWVSANTLAIISKATPENYFVGYALAFKDNQGHADYEYFDRYPVFFSALFNRALVVSDNLAEQFYLAKQIMNLIFLGTLILAFFIIDKLIKNKPVALTIVLLAFSNPYLLWYKDMVHFDQPALWGFLLLIYAISLYKLDGVKKPLYIAVLVAIGSGRGYASYSILFLWLALEAFPILKTAGLSLREKIKGIVHHPSFLLLVIALVWGAALLSYNIIIEAHKRDVSILQTSILRSARYRLSLNPEFNQENEGVINWRIFTENQVNRIVQWAFPVGGVNLGLFLNSLVLVLMLLLIGIMIWKQSGEKKTIYLILILSGVGWLIPLRNLAAFHDYTAMYYIGIPLTFFAAVFSFLNPPKKLAYFLAILALCLYISNIVQVKDWHEQRMGKANLYMYDFVRIRDKIEGEGRNINMPEVVPHGPFPPGFYLHEHYLTSRETADYVVTRNRKFPGKNLTPDNDVIFLFEK